MDLIIFFTVVLFPSLLLSSHFYSLSATLGSYWDSFSNLFKLYLSNNLCLCVVFSIAQFWVFFKTSIMTSSLTSKLLSNVFNYFQIYRSLQNFLLSPNLIA